MIAPLAIEHEGKADARTVAFLGLEAHPWRISEDAEELEAVRRVEIHPTQDFRWNRQTTHQNGDPLKAWREHRRLTR